MTSKKLLDSIPETIFLAGIIFILLISMFSLFYGFYPGGLCKDTVSMIHSGVTGEYTNTDPPVLQMFAGLAYLIYPNQSPLLLIQLAGYFTGIFLLSFYFIKISKRITAIVLIVLAWFPYNIFLHAMVVKDVLLMIVWLNLFALVIHSTIIREKKYRRIILIINIALLLFGILVRDNALTATPALLFMALYGYDTRLMNARSLPVKTAIAVCSLVLAFLFMQGINGVFLSGRTHARDYNRSYFVDQVCKYDLLGMSVLDGHSGITSALSKKKQSQLERIYTILPIYWTVKIDETHTGKDADVFAEWKKAVRHNPILYIRHRFHIFIKTFGGDPFSQLMWVNQAQPGAFKKKMLSFNEAPPDAFYTPQTHMNNIVYRSVRSYLTVYFNRFGSALPFAVIGLLIMVHCVYLAYGKKQNLPVIPIIFLMNLASVLYYAPYLFFVHQAETRYVYPSMVLIILTIPFYYTYCILNRKNNDKNLT